MSLKKDIIETEFRTSGANTLQNDISKVEGNIKRLNSENERLRINKKKLESQNKKNTKEWQFLDQQIKKNRLSLDSYNTELGELNSKLKVTDMTAKQLIKTKSNLARQLNSTSKAADPAKWEKLNKEYKSVTTQLGKVQAGSARVGKTMQAFKMLLPIAGVGFLLSKLKDLGTELFGLAKIIQGDAVRSSVVFGDELGYVTEQSKKLAKQMGLTNREFVAAAAGTADLLIPLDFTRKQAASMSVELQSLAGALDEWTGGQLGATQVSEILTKAMLGENEQLKQLGIAIRKDTDEFRDLVKQKIAATGATKVQAEAMATLELIQKKSADAQAAYTREGNKLLRTQKAISVWLKNLKEGFVGLFEEDEVQKVRDERIEMNNLAEFITKTAEGTDERRKAVETFNTKYGKYLENLLTEKSTLEDIRDAQNEANTALVSNIALKEQEAIRSKFYELQKDPINKILAKVEKNKPGTSDVVASQMNNILAGFKELIPVLEPGQVYSEETAKSITNYLVATGQKYGVASTDLRKQFYELVALETEMQKQLQESANMTAAILGGNASDYNFLSGGSGGSASGSEGSGGGDGGTDAADAAKKAAEKAAKEKQAAYNKALDDLKQIYLDEQNVTTQFRRDNIISEEQYQEDLLALKISRINLEIEIRKQYNEDTSALELELVQIELEYMNQEQAAKNKLREEEKIANEKAATEKKVLREKELTELQADMQKKINYANQLSTDVANTLTGSFNARKDSQKKYNNEIAALEKSRMEGELSQEEYKEQLAALNTARKKEEIAEEENRGKELLKLALQYLKKYALAKIAETTIGSMASAESIATFGIAGIAKAAILSALIEGAVSIAEGAINRFDTGGPTGPGTKHQPAGIVHANEYVIPQEGYFNPNLRPFINMIESARQSGSLRSLNISNTSLPGLAEGGPSSPNLSPASSPLDPAIVELLKLNATYLGQLLKNGTFAKFDDEVIRDIRNRTKIITNIEDSTRA